MEFDMLVSHYEHRSAKVFAVQSPETLLRLAAYICTGCQARFPMRSLSALFLLPFVSTVVTAAIAQDPGMMAAQQATQTATQISVQQSQLAIQQAQQASQQANADAANAAPMANMTPGVFAEAPKFSERAGRFPGPITVKLKGPKGSTMYYTTDGWTPTTRSTPYTGPITISATARLEAIAIVPGGTRSLVRSADYVVGTAASAAALDKPTATSEAGKVELVFTAPVTPKGLDIGDKLPVALAEDLTVNGRLFAPKGTPAVVTVTQVYESGHAGTPGSISFAVHSVSVDGRTVPLSGTETLEGEWKVNSLRKAMIPVIGPAFLLQRGTNPEIEPGTMMSATIEPDRVATAASR
jgi:hypothetical protein